jgi:phage/plasmid-like protein (TIGR03299 family)
LSGVWDRRTRLRAPANAEAFEFFDPLVQSGDAVYETAGALGKGERVWVLARLNGELAIAEGDPTRRYLLLSNSHDGTSSVQMKITAVRVVCNNTLTLALREGGTIRIRHDRDLWSGLDEAKALLGVIESTFDRLEQSFLAMAGARALDDAVNQYLAMVFPYPQDRADRLAAKRVDRQRKCAFHLSKHGKGNENPKVQGTVWAAYNGVTELIDHGKMAKVGADHSSRRLHSGWFGQGAAVKARALQLATEWVETLSPS